MEKSKRNKTVRNFRSVIAAPLKVSSPSGSALPDFEGRARGPSDTSPRLFRDHSTARRRRRGGRTPRRWPGPILKFRFFHRAGRPLPLKWWLPRRFGFLVFLVGLFRRLPLF